MFVDLELFKKYVRADDFDGDDEILKHYIEVGEKMALEEIHATQSDLIDRFGSVPKPVEHAAMILAAEYYAHAEASDNGNLQPVPYGVKFLLKPYSFMGVRALDRAKRGGDS